MAKASAHITLTYVIDIVATYRYYLLQSSTMAKPAVPTTNPPSSSWDDSEPTYTSGSTNSLYYVDLTVFSDDTFSYSPVSLSTAYEAAKEAYNKADNAQTRISEAETKIEKTDEAITLCALKSETVPVPIITDNGSQTVKIANAFRDSIKGIKLYGKSTQFVTTGKNLISNNQTTTTKNGLRFVVNDDKSVTVNGVATAQTSFAFTVPTDIAGCILSGCPTGGSSQTYCLMASYYTNGSWQAEAYDIGSGLTLLDGYDTIYVSILVRNGARMSNVTFYPMVRDASITDTTYEPYSGGVASPSLQWTQDIASIGASGAVDVAVTGKNILPYPYADTTKTTNGITFTDNGDGSITCVGTATDLAFFNFSYTKWSDMTLVDTGTATDGNICISLTGDHPAGVTLNYYNANECTYITVGTGVTVNCTVYPQIEYGSEPTSYEPYKNTGAVSAFTPNGLPGIPVTSGGNYTDHDGQQWICDEIDFEREVYVQRIRQLHLAFANMNNSESYPGWKLTGEDNVVLDDLGSYNTAVANITPYMCNITNGIVGAMPYINSLADSVTVIFFNPASLDDMTQSEAAEAYANTEMVLFYAIKNRVIEIPLTDEQIAAFHALANDPGYVVVQSEAEMLLELDDIATGKSIVALTNTMDTQLNVLSDRIEMNFLNTTTRYNNVNDKLEVEIINRKKHITYAGDTAITIGGNSGILMSLDNDNGIIFSKIVSVTGSNPDDLDSTISTMYQLHDNSTTAPTGAWSTSLPDMSSADASEKFLWIRRTTTYTDGTTSTMDSVAFGTWDGDNFHTGSIYIKLNERAQFGNFAYIPRTDGSLSFLKVGG